MLSACSLSFLHTVAQESDGERWLLGLGATYCSYVDNPGVNFNATYRVVGNLHVGPDFSAVLTKEIKEDGRVVKRKELEYNFNAQQLFLVSKSISLYPLLGINFSKVTIHPDGEAPDKKVVTALNAGGGIEWKREKVRWFFESKYVSWFHKYDLTAGVLIAL